MFTARLLEYESDLHKCHSINLKERNLKMNEDVNLGKLASKNLFKHAQLSVSLKIHESSQLKLEKWKEINSRNAYCSQRDTNWFSTSQLCHRQIAIKEWLN